MPSCILCGGDLWLRFDDVYVCVDCGETVRQAKLIGGVELCEET